MNKEEIKLTEYLHNIIENNMSLRKENDRLWKQKLEYIDRISRAIEYIGNKNIGVPRKTREKAIAILGGKE